ncbi:carboxypeptidase-like regulatory domain-containing protein [Rubinisphaera margarita]|uniref:carboxypeptidase-like regulatory domain-containing protein n=1 Tax=Rubinisphaera margarita TaxID=2909586 RepID=UPI001EE7C57F|nr:carboxypeptidase-like regulatory domain-containing protein [Rubinisphaera margarita]MCG6155043.1 carboxypeptidase-like regulatory domain-containing protein [Rubinisphaera margarita]
MVSFAHSHRLVLACFTLIFLTGCFASEETGPEKILIPVTGTILLDGEPLANAAVNFQPTKGTTTQGAYGVTDAAGKFTAKQYSQTEGVEPGTYSVTFSKIAMPDGSPIPEGQTAADVGAVESLPPHLTAASETGSKYVLTVAAEPVLADYELKSRP